jgi:hypothetical protein
MLHSRPEQQSAVVVQSPALGTQTSSHLPLTQGLPQQSALVEQIEPAGTPASVQRKFTPRQRGMPSASREQHSSGLLLHVPFGVLPPSGRRLSQQLLEVPPHAPLGALQTAPGRRHCGPSQRPSVSPAGMMHWSGGDRREDEQPQSQPVLAVKHRYEDERQNQHPQHGELIRNRQDLPHQRLPLFRWHQDRSPGGWPGDRIVGIRGQISL